MSPLNSEGIWTLLVNHGGAWIGHFSITGYDATNKVIYENKDNVGSAQFSIPAQVTEVMLTVSSTRPPGHIVFSEKITRDEMFEMPGHKRFIKTGGPVWNETCKLIDKSDEGEEVVRSFMRV